MPQRQSAAETIQDSKEHFLRNIAQMRNNAVLMREIGERRLEPVFVSDEFAQMMECTVEEAYDLLEGTGFYKGIGFYKTTVADDRPLVRSMMERHVAYDGSSALTIQKITAQHNKVWCNVHYAFIDDFDEHYIYCTYTDVTTLKEHEEQLKTTYSNLGGSFYQESARTFANLRINLTRDAIEEASGSDLYESDVVGSTYTEAIRHRAEYFPISSEREQFLELFDRRRLSRIYLTGQSTEEFVAFTMRHNGQSCFVKLNATITQHPLSGDVIAFFSEQEYNSEKVSDVLSSKILAEQFDMVAYLVDGTYGVTIGDGSNIKYGSIFPTTLQGIYENYLESQVAPVLSGTKEEKADMMAALRLSTVEEQLKVKEPYVVNISIEMDGETYYKQFDFFTVNPEARFYILLKSDTTEIQKQHMELNNQLRNALEAANQANVAKTAFLSSMSHEIRTPMNAIIGLDSIALADPNLPDRTREQLEKIGASAQHLLELINDILDMSRIESGRLTIKSEEFSFAEMLEQINTMINSQCQDCGLTYECNVVGQLDDYYIGDPMKLKQVIINILGNAVKFTPAPGTVSITVERTAQFNGQATIRFIMADTGIGMDKDYLPKIFDAFSQENESHTNKYGSTGLGMAITKNIVELMNGTITVESEKGVGSVFTVTVTLHQSERKMTREMGGDSSDSKPLFSLNGISGSQPDKAGAQSNAEEKPLANLEGRHILLAEDMPINAEIMIEILAMMDIEVEHAENGQVAVDMFCAAPEGHFDAILMDVKMPVLDGLGATKAIRALDRDDAKRVPIIAMTANAFDEDVQRSLQAGMTAHLTKPVEPDRLFATLGMLIEH